MALFLGYAISRATTRGHCKDKIHDEAQLHKNNFVFLDHEMGDHYLFGGGYVCYLNVYSMWSQPTGKLCKQTSLMSGVRWKSFASTSCV